MTMTEATFTIVTRAGECHTLAAEAGRSLMEVIRDAGISDLLAMCGGCCSCATCHVYIERGWETLPPLSPDEDDLLDASEHRRPSSRLSCQISASARLAVRIAPD